MKAILNTKIDRETALSLIGRLYEIVHDTGNGNGQSSRLYIPTAQQLAMTWPRPRNTKLFRTARLLLAGAIIGRESGNAIESFNELNNSERAFLWAVLHNNEAVMIISAIMIYLVDSFENEKNNTMVK